jgi:hypothetical protein
MKLRSTVLPVVFLAIALTSCLDNSMKFQQKVESPDGKYNYCLYLNSGGFGDPGFWVIKLDKRVDPKKIYIDSVGHIRDWKEVTKWIKDRQILSNYDEGGKYTSNPKIEIRSNRFLTLSRGGFYFELYDIKLDKAIFNTFSPWGDWSPTSTAMKADKLDDDLVKKEYGEWIKVHLNDPIIDYIEKNS